MNRCRQALAALLCAWSLSALAGPVLYDNGTTVEGGWPSMGAGTPVVDDFQLAPGSSTLAGVRWTGLYSSASVPAAEAFVARIFADAGGSPGPAPALHTLQLSPARLDTGIDIPYYNSETRDLLEYSVDLAPLALAANTVYWLSIATLNAPADGNVWFWGSDVGAGNAQFMAEQSWIPLGLSMDFQLTGPDQRQIDPARVPAPGTLTLLGLGFAGLWGAGRRVKPKA